MSLPVSLDDWLAHCERLHPKTIDMTLDRVTTLRERLGLNFEPPVVVVLWSMVLRLMVEVPVGSFGIAP